MENLALELVSLGEESPSGENLEYESVFTELEIAAQPGQERQMGSEIVAAEEPDYADVIQKARAVLERSHDVRAAIHLAHAQLRRNGFVGFAEATSYIRGCVTEFWDTFHPQLDEDDGDPTMRVNAVRGLAAPETVIHALRLANMTDSNNFGRMCLRHKMILDGEIDPHDDEHLPDSAGFSAAFRDTDEAVMQGIIDAVRQASEDIAAIEAKFDEKIGSLGPDLGEAGKTLARILSILSAETGMDVEAAPEAEEQPEVAALAGRPSGSGGPPGAIMNDRDVLAAIDRIIEYYARYEPSNPVPILLKRARRLVGADFITIVNDLAPLGLDHVRLVGGLETDEKADPKAEKGGKKG
ncbi:type VI secretion system protein TssA [Pseudoruegeria sp. M32A2M]|nr:type VI secretion system protein TssA [Pseudoruegeria sp. M32A2M]